MQSSKDLLFIKLFINILMDYLTNYYKNLCEQLQEKINILEANIRSPEQIQQVGDKLRDEAIGSYINTHGKRPSGNEYSDIILKTSARYAGKAAGRNWDNTEVSRKLGDIAQAGDAETVRSIGNVLAAQGDVRSGPMKVAGAENPGKPVSISDLRTFVKVARGKYQVPWQEEPQKSLEISADNFDGPDEGSEGSTSEVVSGLKNTAYTGSYETPSQMSSDFMAGNGSNKKQVPPGFARRI